MMPFFRWSIGLGNEEMPDQIASLHERVKNMAEIPSEKLRRCSL